MYLKIRKIGGKPDENDLIINISKKAKIEELREMIDKEIKVKPAQQVLLYKGKQLVDDHKIMDYDIRLNDVIQLMIKLLPTNNEGMEENIHESSTNKDSRLEKNLDSNSEYYKLGDLIDVRLPDTGAWYEAKITKIFKKENDEKSSDTNSKEENLYFRVKSEEHVHVIGYEVDVQFDEIRPRSHYKYNWEELKADMLVLANYNLEKPKTRGLWFDFKITEVVKKNLMGTIFMGKDKASIENCSIHFIDEILRIESPVLLTEKTADISKVILYKRIYPLYCEKCRDIKTRKCRECGCKICAGKNDIDKIILCDECDYGYHITCLTPPLESVPEDHEWYCPECKTDDTEIVKAGEKLKTSKKKERMPSSKTESTRDWGKGMACVGRTKECTLVEKNHFGPIPGVEVGTCWKYRIQVSEAGIHRALVAGIHGRENEGAYSLVLSGGYEDDVDNGKEFLYTGSGGRDLSGNKRSNKQSCDQVLTRMNKALAMNCYAPLNNKTGSESKEWKKGKPVRVVRNFKGAVHSKYAPKEGNRYDGVYKVVKYYPEKGKSGFIVWKYLLRRDDPSPAPWEEDGQEFDMIYPPGYLEAQEAAKLEKEKEKTVKDADKSQKGSKRKKSLITSPITNFFASSPKKLKLQEYKLPSDVKNLIEKDVTNEKLWSECKKVVRDGKQAFLSKVEELFVCICCQEIVFKPVSTPCKHNLCRECLKRSFSAEIYTCPYCRFELGKEFTMALNENLGETLQLLFPGYENTR